MFPYPSHPSISSWKSCFYLFDKDFSVTLNAFFVVRWKDSRLVIDQDRIDQILGSDASLEPEWIPVDVSFIKEFWLPDAEILNLKEFKTLDVLSKLEGLWLNRDFEIMYAVATRITFICPMTFNSFPLDVQVCLFQVKDPLFIITKDNMYRKETIDKSNSYLFFFYSYL